MLKAILTIGSIQAVAIAIQFIRSKVVAILLGPEGVGVVSTIDQFVQFAAYATALSIPLASIKFLSQAHSEGHEAFKRCYAGFLQILFFLVVFGTVLTIGLLFIKADIFGAEVHKYRIYLLIALISIPTLVFAGFFTNVLAAAQNYRASAALAVISNGVTTIFIIGGISTAGVLGLFIGSSLAGIVITLGTLIYFWRRMDLPFFNWNAKNLSGFSLNSKVISFTAMLYFGSLSYSLSQVVARYAVLTNFGEAETGLLQGALVLSVAIGMVLGPANGLYLTPLMNRKIEKTQKIRHAVEFQRKIIVILFLVMLPVVMFPETMLTVMFSAKFASVGNLVFLFIIAQFVTFLSGIHQSLMIGTNDLKAYTLITTAGQIGFVALAWFSVPVFGIKGIAVSSIASSAAIFFATLIRLKSKHDYKIPSNLSRLIIYSLFALSLTGWVCGQTAELNAAAVSFKVGSFVFLAASLLLFMDKDEITAIYAMRNKILLG